MKKFTFNKIEPLFFLAILLVNLFPLFSGKFFPTMDGAAHLNNATIIKELLFNGSSSLNDVFQLNPEPVPNWIGHFLLVLFKLFLPAYFAEKILLLIYFVGLPLAFRSLIKTIASNNIVYSYFIFPFTYSSFILFGFYNFSIGIVLYIISLTYWLKTDKNTIGKQNLITLFLLFSLTYFSHIFLFVILLLTIVVHTIIIYFSEYFNNSTDFKKVMTNFFKVSFYALLISIIPLCLFLYYLVSRKSLNNSHHVPIEDLIAWIKNIRPIITYNLTLEEAFTTKIFYAIAILLIVGSYNWVNSIFSKENNKKINLSLLFNSKNTWLVVSLVLLSMYFFLPLADDSDSGGYFKVRLSLLFFIILLIWISTFNISRWLVVFAVTVVLFFHFKRNNYYASVIKDLDVHAQELYAISSKIPENSVVLPIDVSGHWLKGHFSNYLGSDKPLVILENYECTKGYFPVKWNDNKLPKFLLNNKNTQDVPCIWWKSNQQNKPYYIDYVIIIGDIGSITDNCLRENTLNSLDIIYQSNESCLLKTKK